MQPPHEKTKELKVLLSREMRIKLHSTKILHGTPIAHVVRDALALYFAEREAEAVQPSRGEAA